MLEKYGLWDQLRVDGGLEFTLICFVQEMVRDFRSNQTRKPWLRTKSTDVSLNKSLIALNMFFIKCINY